MSSASGDNVDEDANRRKALREELQFLGQMASTETALFHQKAAEHYGMGITEMKALSTLMQEGDMTAGQLADRLSLTTGAVTSLLDRLERRGAVKRKADPKDRRKVIASVNMKHLHKDGNVYSSVGESFDKLVRTYSTEELEFLVDYYRQTIELTKQEIARLRRRVDT